MKITREYILPGISLAMILGAVPAILLAAKPPGFPFGIFKYSNTSHLFLSTAWLLWLIVAGIFLLELAAVLRGRFIPLFLPVIQRPISKMITSFFVQSSKESVSEHKARPLMMDGLIAAHGLQNSNNLQPASSLQTMSDANQMSDTNPLSDVNHISDTNSMSGVNHISDTNSMSGANQVLTSAPHSNILQIKTPSSSRRRLAKITAYALAFEDAKLRSLKLPQILGICLETDIAKVILQEPAEPPEGFQLKEDGSIWEMPLSQVDALPEPKSAGAVLQIMLLMGYYKGGNKFYLNLEVASQLAVYGDQMEILNFLLERVVDLTADDFYCGARIFCVGFGYEISQHKQIMAVDRLSDILPAIQKQAGIFKQASAGESFSKKGHLPVLVMDPFTDKRELTDTLEALAGGGISVVLGYGACKWALEIDKSQVSLSPLGIILSRTPKETLPDSAAETIQKHTNGPRTPKETLPISTLSQNGRNMQAREDKTVENETSGNNTAENKDAENEIRESNAVEGKAVKSKTSASKDAENEITEGKAAESSTAESEAVQNTKPEKSPEKSPQEPSHQKPSHQNPGVEILGAVRVKNPLEAFTSMQSVSLVCFLAVNRNGVSSDYLMRWLWHPDEPPTRQILANVVSRARRCLGSSQDGQSYISYEGGIYRLHEKVTADFEIFRQYLKKSKEAKEESEKLKFLSSALSMVKGVPFLVGSSRAFRWADNGFRSELEFEIDTAVHQLVELAVKRDDFDLARSAIAKGLECIPGCEQCMARLLVLNAKTKNCGALIKAKEDMLVAYSSLGYEVPESLLDLFSQLYEGIKSAS